MRQIKKIIRRLLPKSAIGVVENVYRKSRGMFWQARYGFPARNTKVVAVTGTNGKSTTCAYINEVLKTAGYKTAVLTTVFYEYAGVREPNETHFTIDRQSIVQRFFARAKKCSVDWIILEVTSHAIDQDRIMGVPVEVAVITNLTQEHLDYHGSMENYAATKARLLSDFEAKYAVLNSDNEWFKFFSRRSKAKVFSFGRGLGAMAGMEQIKTSSKSSSVILKTNKTTFRLKTGLQGEFNLYNAAAAASVGLVLNLPIKKIEGGIAALKFVQGRMEPVEAGQKFEVLIDFAITPDAIEQALKSLKKTTKNSVRVVFGATGDRDKEKRPEMGRVAAEQADFIYLTDDETYTENPKKIRDDVYKGIEQAKGEKKTKVIADREEAIKAALKDAGKGDTVLITGLGHENSRNMGGKLIPWSDKDTAEKTIKALGR